MIKEMQTAVKHSTYLKYLIDKARGMVPTINGMGVSKQDFFILAAGEKATRIIKNSPALNYEEVKNEFERIHGAVEEYGDDVEVGNEEFAEEDSILQELEKS